jgi:DNA-binding winged helix-turn-helix (wHTH) protein
MVSFGLFSLDPKNEQLWHGTRVVALKPKTFAVLRYLVQRAGQLVTKDDLLAALWPETYVSEATLTVCIGELRKALGDRAKAPQYIETVHRRGYRFIAPLQEASPASLGQSLVGQRSGAGGHVVPSLLPIPAAPVGRETELAQLRHWWQRARQGQRRLVFVTGEPGIGKTTVVQAFVAHLETTEDLWHGHGQCIDHYGVGEAYLPVLEALGRLCRGPEGGRFIDLLVQHAPSWVVHLPTVRSAEAAATLQRTVSGPTPEGMLRELAEAVDALTAVRPLLLTFEDLHWSDTSTLVLLSALAQRPEPARRWCWRPTGRWRSSCVTILSKPSSRTC